MKVQWSLRTLLIVMTLGGPLLAAGVSVASKVATFLSPCEEVHPDEHLIIGVYWKEALREAAKVQPLSIGSQVRRKADSTQNLPLENSLQSPGSID